MNLLILNLAVADALYAALITPKLIVSLNLNHPTGLAGTILCKLLTGGGFAWVAAICAIPTLVAIAVERYYAVVYPLGNKWKCTHRDVKVCIEIFVNYSGADLGVGEGGGFRGCAPPPP